KVLSSFNISEDNVRDEVFNLINEGDDATASIRYTPRAKKVIELSMDEARKLHHNFVGTEHLLLGLIRESEGVAARVLANLDLNMTKARASVIKMLCNPETLQGKDPQKKDNNTPTLDSLARDLPEIAKEDQLDPVIGRSKEVTRVIEV